MSAAAAVEAVGSGIGCARRVPCHLRSQPHTDSDLKRPQLRARVQPRAATPYRARNATAAARKYSAEEEAILAAQLARAACHGVSSVDARYFAPN
jgi:hypothetical protein